MTEPVPSTPTSAAAESIASQTTADRSRRRSLIAGTAVVAAVVGGGAGWWATRRGHASESGSNSASSSAPEPAPGFWTWSWPSAKGGVVALQDSRNSPILLNFWATWCAPCVAELPLINDFYLKKRSEGWQVIAVAIDKLALVEGFLQKTPLDFSVAVAGMGGLSAARSLGNLSGGLPFSVALDRAGAVALRKLGSLGAEDFALLSGLK